MRAPKLLNRSELLANWHNFESWRRPSLCAYLQGFHHTSTGVRYRLRSGRSQVQILPGAPSDAHPSLTQRKELLPGLAAEKELVPCSEADCCYLTVSVTGIVTVWPPLMPVILIGHVPTEVLLVVTTRVVEVDVVTGT